MKEKFLHNKMFLLLILVSALVLGLSGCSDKGAEKGIDSGKKTVVVGLDNTFVPMGFLDEKNELVGFDIDLAKEVFKRVGYEAKFENIDWTMKEQTLNNGNIDCIWNGYSITDARKEKVDFSIAYFDNRQIIVAMSDSGFKKPEDLKGQVVGTQEASTGLAAIEKDENFLALIKDQKPVTYATYDNALRDLETQRVSAIVGDEVLLKYYMKQKGEDKYFVLEGDLGSEEYGVGFRKGDVLREAVDKALNEMIKDGSFDEIKSKWFKD